MMLCVLGVASLWAERLRERERTYVCCESCVERGKWVCSIF